MLILRLSYFSGLGTDLKEGILDPFPLLRTDDTSFKKRKGKARLVNPLLLVTERKGTMSSLHYGSFPLDAFNTDGMGTHSLHRRRSNRSAVQYNESLSDPVALREFR